jgi:hypothetical protein
VRYDVYSCVASGGFVMAGLYAVWQLVVAWLFVTAIAATYYFAPIASLIDKLGD